MDKKKKNRFIPSGIDLTLIGVAVVLVATGWMLVCFSHRWWGCCLSALDVRVWPLWKSIGLGVIVAYSVVIVRYWPKCIGFLLFSAIAGLSILLAAMLFGTTIEAWRNPPLPGQQVARQYAAKRGAAPIDYLLYLPQEYGKDENAKWPLVVYLHGAKSRGKDLELVRREGPPGQIAQGEQFGFVLLSPQCPAGSEWSPELIIGLIEHISSTLSVDRNRIYLTGFDTGGTGTWATAIHDPDRFAAIAPVCGRGDITQAERLKTLPIWAFYGKKDRVAPLEAGLAMPEALRKCGGRVRLKVYPDGTPDISAATYQDKQFYRWLLAQNRTRMMNRGGNVFEPREYRCGQPPQQQSFRYFLSAPPGVKASERYPLLVWLSHDSADGAGNLRWAIHAPGQREKRPFFILAVPCPPSDSKWFSCVGAMNYADADAALGRRMLEQVLRDCPVDPRRVYVSGVSRGGGRCWQMALRHPDLFAAVSPMASGCGEVSQASQLSDLPVWVFHGCQDSGTPADSDKRMVAAVKAAGGNIRLTLTPAPGHDCWTAAFKDYGAMEWMLTQRRGLCWTPLDCEPWNWWHILMLPCAFLVFLRLGWYVARGRRQHIKA